MQAAHSVGSQVMPSGSCDFGDDVGERQAAAGFQQARGLVEDLALVRREVDHAVADDGIARRVATGRPVAWM